MSKVTLQNYRFYREQGGWKVLFFEVSILSKYYSTPIKALKKMEIHLLGLFFLSLFKLLCHINGKCLILYH